MVPCCLVCTEHPHAAMEVARRSPVVMLLLCLLLNDAVQAFVIDRPSKETNELTEALKVIQRAKRRLLDETPEPEAGYYWQNMGDVPFEDGGEGDNGVLEDLFAEGPMEGVLSDQENSWGEEVPEDEVLEPGTETVDKAELEDMFEDKKEEDKKEYDPSVDMKKREDENTLSDAEVENLLDTAKDTEIKVLSEGGSNKPVAKEEIKQVLAVAEPNGDGTEKVKVKEDNWLITPEKTLHNSHEDEKDIPEEALTNVNKEWLMNLNDDEPAERNIKKKRSGDPVLAEAAARERQEEEEDADLTYIKEFIELEDDENNNLANALNLATLSQVERTDKYIPLEVQYLKQSIKDEETIQSIKESLGITQDSSDDEEDEAEEEMLEPEINPLEEENPAFEEEEEEEEAEDEIHDVLSQKLRQFLLRTAIANRQEEALQSNADNGAWYNLPVNPSREGQEEGKASLSMQAT